MTAQVMMQLGAFQFGLETAAYQEFTRENAWRWPALELFKKAPSLQFTGAGEETISLPGVIYPFYRGGLGQVDQMRTMAGKGQPLELVASDGRSMGQWVIETLSEGQNTFAAGGIPMRVDFTLSLRRFAEAPATTVDIGRALSGPAAVPVASGPAAQLSATAQDLSQSSASMSGSLNAAAEQIRLKVAPLAEVGKEAIGALSRASSALSELHNLANRSLVMVGARPISSNAINIAQNISQRARSMQPIMDSTSNVLRRAADAVDQMSHLPTDSKHLLRAAIRTSERASALTRQAATDAASIKE